MAIINTGFALISCPSSYIDHNQQQIATTVAFVM
jgi:hypothetical protein